MFRQFADEELDFVQAFKVGELRVEAGGTLFLEGNNSAHVYTVLEGWAFRYKLLDDGRRQILNFALPGDFIGLQSAILDEMQHSIETLTDVTLCVFSRDRLWELYQKHASLAFDVTWLASREECLLHEHLLSLGRRTALERTSHLLLHLHGRAIDTIGKTKSSIDFPLTQHHVADALGLSMVHTNRTLRTLRQRKLIDWSKRRLSILDMERLAEIAGVDPPSKSLRPLI